MIAGFEKPDSGRIELDGRDVAGDPPHRRPVNTVFQTYALFPFMTVADNVAFGLKYQKTSREDTRRRVGEALELVQMGTFAKRRPAQLSGGQQQRVALARALVLRPRVLLLDEPLGALDAKLRRQLQLELRAVQREVGITFVYVTHDQEEALTMSDQIAVLADGRVEQVGPPQEIYSRPPPPSSPGSSAPPTSSTPTCSRSPTRRRSCSALDTRLGAVVDHRRRRGAAAIVIRPERIALQGADETGAAGSQRHQRDGDTGCLPRALHPGARRRRRRNGIGRRGAQRAGPASVTHAPGSAVTCVCAHDAVRVLHRSAASRRPIRGDGRRRGAQPLFGLSFFWLFFAGGRSSSRSAKRIAMS